jgi:3-deoxy-D-manno-octulosonate 8-phosphate phosphatase (KDO 8-P phosphatase)
MSQPVDSTTKRILPSGWHPRCFVLDVDGVMTNGQFIYSKDGKAYKIFGPDDHDALLLLKPHMSIRFITGDRKGLDITRRRIVDDMKFELEVVSTIQRARWFRDTMNPAEAVYMGDGIFDPYVFPVVGYAICPANGFYLARERADFVTRAEGGNRAVAEACLHLLEKFFTPFDPERPLGQFAGSGEWTL